MLNCIFKPHRAHLKARTADVQKVFAMLKLIPHLELAGARPPLAFALVVDTSGSMHDTAVVNKLEQALRAAHVLIDDQRLSPDDQVAVIHFNDSAQTLLPLTPLSQKRAAHGAVEAMRQYSGGTHIAQGIRCARRELSRLPPQVAKRVLLLTDGETVDEEDCRALAEELSNTNAPFITIGIGDEYNEDLLRDLAEFSQGRPYHLQDMAQLAAILDAEVESSVREVVTDLQATVSTVQGVHLDTLTRVYPSLAEVSTTTQPYRLGNIGSGDYTIFILEFTLSGVARPASRARIAQLGLSGHVPALNRRDELPPQDLFVAFTLDEAATADVEAEVLGYVQQKNVDRMVQDAVHLAATDAGRARSTLEAAAGVTQRLGNAPMTQMLEAALDEFDRTGTLSPGMRKKVSLGGRTQTMKTGAVDSQEGVPSEEEIRKLTGA